mgnify:CR=1 FL=1
MPPLRRPGRRNGAPRRHAPAAEAATARDPSPLPDLDPGDVGATAARSGARVKAILLAPSATRPVIAAEPYVCRGHLRPLCGSRCAAIGVIAAFIGQTVIGYNVPLLGHMRTGIVAGLGAAVLGYLLSFVSVFVIAWLVDVLAPTFGGQRDPLRALKLTAYSYTPAWGGRQFSSSFPRSASSRCWPDATACTCSISACRC